MNETLQTLFDNVHDLDSFLAYTRALATDREIAAKAEQASPSLYAPVNGWENASIESFLEAAIAWAHDAKGTKHGMGETATWQSFAQFLHAGKTYE